MTLPLPRGDDVVSDVTTGLGEFLGRSVNLTVERADMQTENLDPP